MLNFPGKMACSTQAVGPQFHKRPHFCSKQAASIVTCCPVTSWCDLQVNLALGQPCSHVFALATSSYLVGRTYVCACLHKALPDISSAAGEGCLALLLGKEYQSAMPAQHLLPKSCSPHQPGIRTTKLPHDNNKYDRSASSQCYLLGHVLTWGTANRH